MNRTLKNRFRGADIFGVPMSLNYREKPIFNTRLGSFLSISISVITFVLFITKTISMAEMSEPNVLILLKTFIDFI